MKIIRGIQNNADVDHLAAEAYREFNQLFAFADDNFHSREFTSQLLVLFIYHVSNLPAPHSIPYDELRAASSLGPLEYFAKLLRKHRSRFF